MGSPEIAPAHIRLSNPWRTQVCRLYSRHCSTNPAIHSVADIGCSDGEVAVSLAASDARLSVVGIDVRPDELAVAEARRASHKLSNVSFEHSYFLDRRDFERFDVVLFSEVYEHLVAEAQVFSLRLLGTMLRAGGYLIFTCPNGRYLNSPLERSRNFAERYVEGFFDDVTQTLHWLEPSMEEIRKIFVSLGFDVVDLGYFNVPLVHRNPRVSSVAIHTLEPILNHWATRWLADRVCKNLYIVARKNQHSRLLRDLALR